ncbi:response regulator receiver and ANTAR domain protein [Microbulbifer donghaiensis]|uniref:Response regulator receiver and ANTAR domain protein n=1 Tax=Microbulbifer donghaiensis TaxID=494016 RepID=A0A1M4YZV8_9GAMM|nr:ANTAR domain-containing protein [Microbulbifer donghaiensis]SHF10856.1 response regulator receiver and ANTAR domain protein [Microbulbifer donghaiensis]
MNRPLGIMLVDDQPQRAQMVGERLRAAGYNLLALLNSAEGLLFQVEKHRPDIVLIDIESPDRDILESLAVINRQAPTPVAMFSARGNADFITRAVESGVSAYMAEGLTADRVAPAIEIAMAQFRSYQQLRVSLERTQQQLDERKAIERAKGLLMAKKNLSEDDAHRALRNLAMNSNTTMRAMAEQIIHLFQPGN